MTIGERIDPELLRQIEQDITDRAIESAERIICKNAAHAGQASAPGPADESKNGA